MIKTLALFSLLLFDVFSRIVFAMDHPELKAFPPAQQDQQRFVIVLPHKERGEDQSYKVEIIPGKVAMTDGVNLTRLSARIEKKPLKGWGYNYYEIMGDGKMMSTLMGVPPGQKPVQKFVKGQPIIIPYNSRLPTVIYAPKGFQLKYRIWNAPEQFNPANPG